MAMQFGLGRPLGLDTLVGIDAAFVPQSAVGLRLGGRDAHGYRCPVPERIDDPFRWKAAMFERVSMKLREAPNSLKVPLSAYLDGVTSHLDLGYLAGQVGLEAFARAIVGPAPINLARDSDAWLTWVRAHADEIRAHGIDAHAARRLVDVVTNAYQGRSSQRVEAAFRQYGVDVPNELVEEIVDGRNHAVHEYLMSLDDAPRDLLKDVDRRDAVLTLLAALVAKVVGYDGPIAGWERDDGGNPLCPPWWPHVADAEALTFSCHRER